MHMPRLSQQKHEPSPEHSLGLFTYFFGYTPFSGPRPTSAELWFTFHFCTERLTLWWLQIRSTGYFVFWYFLYLGGPQYYWRKTTVIESSAPTLQDIGWHIGKPRPATKRHPLNSTDVTQKEGRSLIDYYG